MSIAEAMRGQISGLNFSDTSTNDRSREAAFIRDQELRFQGQAVLGGTNALPDTTGSDINRSGQTAA